MSSYNVRIKPPSHPSPKLLEIPVNIPDPAESQAQHRTHGFFFEQRDNVTAWTLKRKTEPSQDEKHFFLVLAPAVAGLRRRCGGLSCSAH